MSTRLSLFLASGAALVVAVPAAAQHAPPLEPVVGSYEGQWEGEWEDEETWRGMWRGTYTDEYGEVFEGQYMGTFVGQTRFVTDDGQVLLLGNDNNWHQGAEGYEGHGRRDHHPHGMDAAPGPQLAYSPAEREQWLADCRFLMADGGGYYDYDSYYERDTDGGLVGGLLGAVVGGVAGNRIGGRGDRLVGTLIGAGVGGIAGVAIGSLIDGDDDDYGHVSFDAEANALWATRYCEAYLRRYELGGGFAMGQGQPVMMLAAAHGSHGHRHGPDCAIRITEEWVEVSEPAPPPRRPHPPHPRPEPQGKIEPLGS